MRREYSMEKYCELKEGCLTVYVPKELDHHQASMLKAEADLMIEACHVRRLVFDFSQTEFMDSSGIGVIIGRTKKLKYFNDSSVSVCNMSDRVDKLLKCAGIYTIIHKL